MSFDQEKQDSESRFIPQNYNGSAQRTIIVPQISWSMRIQGKTRKRRAGGNGKKGIYQAFLVVLSLGIHAHDHPNFPFSIKIVLEEMSQFGISVRNHLGITATEDPVSFPYPGHRIQGYLGKGCPPCLFHTIGFPGEPRCTSSVSSGTG